MYSNRDFIGKKITDRQGRKMGTVEDLLLDVKHGLVCGFKIRESSMRRRYTSLHLRDILYIGNTMIADRFSSENFFCFEGLRTMEIINLSGDILGSVESILFCREDFKIKGFLVSEGLLRNYIKGKRIILLSHLIIGENNILYTGDNNYCCYSKIHGVEKNE
ncbi:Uncharacterized protein YrrD, contains PRC-barrel domain [Hathewaya proteolytica DSM 3090]|uniref:Uncharacterized protein YrrD, contains PRC-barrel domain n=1 Tax=Hathewaya proteolytica DSM 3090 TaxID=1121331 RepID=A0A1M6JDE7_9CLOT|nr:PRC-barrel domain-containing protein [Hathewaya proteolytica]SHJ44664.1 Uncharacterized protein YrrD, contains PRC-barrel domain [Hathewaya proteolytica DSM 3090]